MILGMDWMGKHGTCIVLGKTNTSITTPEVMVAKVAMKRSRIPQYKQQKHKAQTVQFSETESGSEVSMEFVQTQQVGQLQATPKTPPMAFPLYQEPSKQESSEEDIEEEVKGKGKELKPLRPLTPEYIGVDPEK